MQISPSAEKTLGRDFQVAYVSDRVINVKLQNIVDLRTEPGVLKCKASPIGTTSTFDRQKDLGTGIVMHRDVF
jgi:hypothetical protein